MRLTENELAHLRELLGEYLSDPEVQRMEEFIQHGSVTTLAHCRNVVRVSYWLNRRLGLGGDDRALAVGALLHDFYLYDWHIPGKSEGLHGLTHPARACRNARERFGIGRKEECIIRSHMWPLTFRTVPTCREAVIVCCADKYCSLLETLMQRKVSRPICR